MSPAETKFGEMGLRKSEDELLTEEAENKKLENNTPTSQLRK